MLLIIHLFIIGSFILLGVVFALGKGAGLIAGYNTASAEAKAKYDEKKLCKAMSKLMFTLAGCWLIIASSEIFKEIALLWVGLTLFFAVSAIGAVCINTGKRYRK